MNLLTFKRPSRYINSEYNSIHKEALLKVALAFPDIYDVGMSHLGLRILYKIINEIPYASAERVFAPWLDMEEGMRKGGLLLSSLESNRPLCDFDIVGFSLQYELSYTTVLNMLNLGGIPFRSEERRKVKKAPLVIAGGPCTLNPYPMAEFIDAFLIGDGEDAIREILEAYQRWKQSGDADRSTLLSALAEIEGIFVPSLERERTVSRRIIASLEDAPFPDSPVLPFANIVHDRVNIEIARGCSMGCRFCQAGMAYRPVRERSPGKVLELAERSLRNTGYEDIAFTSLSAGDYSCLPELMREFNRRFAGKRIAISLPSLRVATVTSGMLKEIRTVRKTGFTMAPEAGTDRLRAVINKDFSHETYLAALETLFQEGWQNLKLYFMTGLPTETHEDLAAIPEMVFQALRISKRLRSRNVNISVGVSSFIPKAHTPFQWFGQNPLEVMQEKNSYLRKAFLKRGVKYKGHDEHMALLEAVFARGDERLSALIEKAWELGCRLDAWTEVFDYSKWEQAMEETGIDAVAFARSEYTRESILPWDNIRTGVTREYLWKEYENAIAGRVTEDCRAQCHVCGLKCTQDNAASPAPGLTPAGTLTPGKKVLPDEFFLRARLQFSKTGKARYLSHLELMTAMLRAMRRADFPLRYSAGFHPSPKVSFGPALGVGVAGLREYLDLELAPPFDAGEGLKSLNKTLPGGLRGNMLALSYGKERSLNTFVVKYVYEIRYDRGLSASRFQEMNEVIAEREKGAIDLKTIVEEIIRVDDNSYRLILMDKGVIKVRLQELLPAIFGIQMEDLDVTRIAMMGWENQWVEPMEGAMVWAVKS